MVLSSVLWWVWAGGMGEEGGCKFHSQFEMFDTVDLR